MTPEQTDHVIGSLGRIEATLVAVKETNERHEQAINASHRRIDDHDKSRARMRGGMTVIGGLFTALIALVVSPWGTP